MNLSHPDRRGRLDELAGQFALGTLPARARRRLTAVARRDPVVGAALREWEQRLAGLAAGIAPIAPPPRVWRRIVERLGLETPPAPETSWRGRLAFWRAFAAVSFVAAVALGVARFVEPPTPTGPVVVVLAGPDAKPVMVATANRGERFLTLKSVAGATPGPDKSFELWALPDGGAPRSLGLIPAGGVTRLPLPGLTDQALAVPALAVSLEPAGGSRTGAPTGPVLYTGKVERMY